MSHWNHLFIVDLAIYVKDPRSVNRSIRSKGPII
nr:MAG TPA: hypothetical protein [Caudoviricetes sp.]